MYFVTQEWFTLTRNRKKSDLKAGITAFEQARVTKLVSPRASVKVLIGLFILFPMGATAQQTEQKSPAATEAKAVGVQGTFGTVVKVINGAKKVYDFGKLCAENQDANRSCFSSTEANRFAELNAKLDSIIKQQAENQAQMMAALQEIYLHLETSELKSEIDKIRNLIGVEVTTAADKLSEYLCGQQYIDAYSKGESHDGCQITDSAGNLDPIATDKYGKPKSVADLYQDGGELPRGDVHGGMVARLVAATIGKWTNSDDYNEQENYLVGKGEELMQAIAGDNQAPGPKNGILNAFISNLSAELRVKQGAKLGQKPVFLNSDFLLAMNEITEYWVSQEALFFSTTIAALQLRDRKTAGDLQLTAEVLARMTEVGVNSSSSGSKHPEWALDMQLTNYSVSEVNPLDSWIILSNGKISRLSMGGNIPTFKQIKAVKDALEKADIKMSTLQKLYPDLLPKGENPAWKAKLGVKHYKRFQISTTTKWSQQEQHENINYYTPDPEAANKHYFGEKYAATYSGDCKTMVRMWDKKPSMKEVAEFDSNNRGGMSGSKFDDNKSGKYTVLVIKRGDGRSWKGDKIKVNSKEQYDDYVTNGAVPVYDLTDNYSFSNGKLKVFGVGTLFQCTGKSGPFSRTVEGKVVTIQEQEIGEDLWQKLVL